MKSILHAYTTINIGAALYIGSPSSMRANCEPDILVVLQFLKRNTHSCALQLDQAHGRPTNKIRFHRIFA